MTIGESILKHRKRLGVSQEELAKRLLVSRQTISQWEKNQTLPTLDNVLRLKDVFKVSADEILNAEEKEKMSVNEESIDTICGALCYAMGIEPPQFSAEKNWHLSYYVDKVFDGEKADRIIIYNPDAIAQWVYRKYPECFADLKDRVGIEIPLATVMPSVTPVCFATLYSGAQPNVHGIHKYEKPVVSIDTLFDALIRAGKRIALVTCKKCSLSRIFLGRDIDYYHFEDGTITDVNAKAAELIMRDEHDLIVVYNGNYDNVMHKYGPESPEALAALKLNCHVFGMFSELVRNNWRHHNTVLGFAMDHGCHEIDNDNGSHGLDMPEDINIVHLYKGYPRKNTNGKQN